MTAEPAPRTAPHPQGVRRFHRAARHRPGHPQGRVRLLPRALGLRQDHAAAHHRRAGGADLGRGLAGRARHLPPAAGAARLRHRVPELRAVPQPDGRRQRGLRAGEPQDVRVREIAAARDGAAQAGGPARQRGQVSGAALRRPAAAHRARARPRHVAGPAAAGRAAVGAGRARARAAAPGDPRACSRRSASPPSW